MFWLVVIGVLLVVIFSPKARGAVISLVIGGTILFFVISFVANHFGLCVKVTLWGGLALVVAGYFINRAETKKTKQMFENWLAQPVDLENIPLQELTECSAIKLFQANDKHTFQNDTIPLGRANAFLNNFDGKNI